MKENDVVYVRAVVQSQKEGAVIVRLEDGFGRAQAVVHQDNLITATP